MGKGGVLVPVLEEVCKQGHAKRVSSLNVDNAQHIGSCGMILLITYFDITWKLTHISTLTLTI